MAQWLDRIKFGDGGDGAPPTSLDTNNGNAFGTCTGNAGSTTLSIVDNHAVWRTVVGDVILIHQSQGTGAGQWELNVATDTLGTGNHTMAYPLSYTYGTGAQIIRVPQYYGGTMSSALTPIYSWDGSSGGIACLMCNGDLTVSGSINVSGNGYRGGISNSGGGGYQGKGNVGNGSVSTSANGNGGGGGYSGAGGARGGGGAGGGNGATGSTGADWTGGGGGTATGGSETGIAALTTATFGGAGGAGGNDDGRNGAGIGGTGGGLIFIFSKNFTLSGSLVNNATAGATDSDNYCGTGGGGAGGSVLIKTQVAVLGTNKITVAAGAGGTTSRGTECGGFGGGGAVGRIRCDYFTSISGSTTPTISSAQDLTLNVAGGSGFFNFF